MPLLSDAHEPPLLSGTEVRVRDVEHVRGLLGKHADAHGWPRKDVMDVEDMLGLDA